MIRKIAPHINLTYTKHSYYVWAMEQNLGFLTNDIARLIRKRFDMSARHLGITGPQWRALLVIVRNPGISQGAVAEYLDVEPITTCRMIDRLEQAGFVERRRHPDDRRAWQLHLTAQAEPLIDALKTHAAYVLDKAQAGFSQEETDLLTKMLVRMRDNLSQMPVDTTPLGQEALHG